MKIPESSLAAFTTYRKNSHFGPPTSTAPWLFPSLSPNFTEMRLYGEKRSCISWRQVSIQIALLCTFERYLYYTRVDFILDLSENFRQCSVIATKGNEQSFRIPSQMCQTILFRLSNFIPVDMNDMESDLALVGWTTEPLYFSCWKGEPVIHINGEREYCWYCNWKVRSLKFSAPCRFISLWNFKGVTGMVLVLFRV